MRTNAWPRSSTIRSLARAIARLQSTSRTPRSPRSSRRRPRWRSHAALRSSQRSSGSTPCVRRPPAHARIATGARSPPHAPTSLRERELVLGPSRSSSWLTRRRAQRAPRRSSSCPSSRERNARSRSSKRRSSTRQGTLRCRRRCTGGWPSSGGSRKGWSGHSAMRVRRSTLPMSSTTTRSAQERSPRSRSSGSTAATQTRLETRSAPTSSPWPPATEEQLHRAEIMLAHVLSWSVLHRAGA